MVKEVNPKKLVLGINPPCSNNFYHSDREYSSSSVLKAILRDPQKYYQKYVLGEEEEQKHNPNFDFGTYIHTAILEPHLLDSEIAFFEGNRRAGQKYKDFKEANKGKVIIMPSQVELGEAMIRSFNSNPYAPGLIKDAVNEETVCAEINGLKVKVRTDSRQGTKIGDVKTTASGVSIEECVNTCLKWDYDLSAALYCDILEAVTGEKHDFYFFFISKLNGQCRTLMASQQFLENGRRKYLDAIELIKEGRKSGDWLSLIKKRPIQELNIPSTHIWRRMNE